MAGLIPQHFIDELLARLDIVEIIDHRVTLKKSGRNYMACCPFHDEKTPSFSVNPDKQFYYCFGCGAGGNAIGFLMEYDRMDFPQAVEQLAGTLGMEVPRDEQTGNPAPRKVHQGLLDVLEKAAAFYQRQLQSHSDRQRAVDYLKGRGLTGAISRDYQIGFAPPGWDNLLHELGTDEQQRKHLVDAGLAIAKDDGRLYDRFRDRIMFPIHDSRGRVIAFGGRVLGDDKPKYLNSPETEVFHKGRELYGLYQARKDRRPMQQLLVVEGYMDVVALAQHDIPHAAATLGTATSTDHLRKIFRYCPQVMFCFDGDEAGRRAAVKALESALPTMEDGRSARFLFLDEGEDPDSLVLKLGSHGFERLMREQSRSLEDFLFDSCNSGGDSLNERATLSKRAAPLIDKLPGGVFKELMLEQLAQRTGLSSDALNKVLDQQRLEKEQRSQAAQPQTHAETAPNYGDPGERKTRRALPAAPVAPMARGFRDPVLLALGTLIQHPAAVDVLDDIEPLRRHASPARDSLLTVIDYLRKKPDASTNFLLGYWTGMPEHDHILASLPLAEADSDADTGRQELRDIIAHIRHKQQQQALLETVDKLRTIPYADLTDEQKQSLLQMTRRPKSTDAH